MINNRDRRTFESFVEFLQEMTQRDFSAESKECRKEREALEKVIGIHDTLARADAVLAQAEKEYDARIAEGDLLVTKHLDGADAKIKTAEAALAINAALAATERTELQEMDEELVRRAEGLDVVSKRVEELETACALRAADLAIVESNLKGREAAVAVREAAAKRFEAWRATVPN